jgi:hypothetical protein
MAESKIPPIPEGIVWEKPEPGALYRHIVPARSGLSTDALTIYFRRIFEVNWMIERHDVYVYVVRYHCGVCGHGEKTAAQVRSHLASHARESMKKVSAAGLRRWAKAIEEITAERDKWKKRAMTAERELRAMRAALVKLGVIK